MRNIADQSLMKKTSFFSLLAHCLFLGLSGFNLNIPQSQKPEEIIVEIKIEKPPLLPKIDVMGGEKKLKEIVKEELPELEPEPEPEPQPEEEKIVEEPELEKQFEETIIEEPKPEPPKEIVKVINPQDEAMLRYQDMVKQRIESCRRYPNWAKRQGFEDGVYLSFIVLSNGKAHDIRVTHPSKFEILNQEAISTVKRASPFLPIPRHFNCFSLEMEVAIVFRLD